METFTYILKSIAILGIFYGIYTMVMRKDTFFTVNRHYLLGGIIASFVLPFLNFETTTYIPAPVIQELPLLETMNTTSWEAMTPEAPAFSVDWLTVLLVVYAVGILVMLFRFILQLSSLWKLIRSGTIVSRNHYVYVKVSASVSPFSFFRYIVYNPSLHSQEEMEMILAHERVHASQLHSIDVLLTQLMLATQWCNPLAWLYKQSLEQNLEFIADSTAAQQVTSYKEYQRTLVKVSSTSYRPALTTNFYHSFIKKRIVMLNKPASQRRNLLKLGLILPALALFMYSFHTKEVVKFEEAREGNNAAFAKAIPSTGDVAMSGNTLNVSINKDFVLEDFNQITVDLFTKGIVFTYGEVRRNKNGTISSMYVITHPANSGKQSRYVLKEKNPGEGIEEATLTFDPETLEVTVTTGISTVDKFSISEEGHIKRPDAVKAVETIFRINQTTTAAELDRIEKTVAVRFPNSQFKFGDRSFDDSGKLVTFSFLTKFNGDDKFSTRFTRDASASNIWAGYSIQVNATNEIIVTEKGPKGVSMKISDEIISFLDGVSLTSPESATPLFEVYDQVNNEAIATSQEIYRFKITKNTTIEELKALKAMLKEKHNATLEYSDVDFNEQDEIISISLNFRDANGNTKNYHTNNDKPISDIFIYRDADGATGMGNASSRVEMEKRMTEMKARMEERREEMLERSEMRRKELKERTEKRQEEMKLRQKQMEEEMEMRKEEMDKRQKKLFGETNLKKKSSDGSISLTDGKKNEPLYVLDGNIVSGIITTGLDPNEIDHINVLKGKNATGKYGKNAKNGVVEITSKSFAQKYNFKTNKSEYQDKADVSGQKLFIVQSEDGITANASDGVVIAIKIEATTTDDQLRKIIDGFVEKGFITQINTERNDDGNIDYISIKLDNKKGSTTATSFGNKKDPINTVWLGYTGDQ